MSEQLALLPGYLTAHLQLTLVALLVGFLTSVLLGVAVVRWRRLEPIVLGAASVVQTIPSLALLAIMVPALALLGATTSRVFGVELRSIGYLPAVIALTLYSMLPILRNTVTGISGVDPSVNEAARAVGMTDWQRLIRVQVPLALPVIIAGIRTATVWVVGIATLSTPVGATSLGNYIFSGLQTRNFTAVMVGCVSSAALALSLDSLIRVLEIGVGKRKRGWIAVPTAILIGLFGYTGYTFVIGWAAPQPTLVTIGAKTFTEQYILSELLGLQVARETGLPTRTLQSLGSTVAFDSLVNGDVDVYVDYSGTIWATIMQRQSLPQERGELLTEVREYLAREHGITLVANLGFENTYALGMARDQARTLGVETIGELAAHAPVLEIAGDYEFFARPEWRAIRDAYGLEFGRQRSMDSSLMYQAVHESQVDVISAFSTDGRIAALDIELLRDDRSVIPPYDAIVLASARLSKSMPQVLQALARLEGRISAPAMRQMNLRVDQGGHLPRAVAEQFLEEFVESEPIHRPSPPPTSPLRGSTRQER
ncbi:MAG: ABC transporter permease/substrate-binding protein [Deltaproteobacteria bacterium]|nr:ABC transporter permease/substrate-binding protein [Deltaproteobacteria bacterium]